MKLKNQNAIKPKKSLSKPSSKSKSKSKPKPKQFNPLEYLNALIQLTNDSTNLKVKKGKPGQHRDLSSALTAASPGLMEKTISLQKIRCKSSYSQCRKKSTGVNNITTTNQNNGSLKQVLDINLNNYIITQQQQSGNCIKFTSVSSQSPSYSNTPYNNQKKQLDELQSQINGYHFNQHKKVSNNPMELKPIPQFRHNSKPIQYRDLNYYARKIQRVWRAYQTYKVVRKYYKQFKKEKRVQKGVLQQQRKMQYTSRNNNPINHNSNNNKQVTPIMHAYLNDYYDQPINPLSINQHQQLLNKTIKFKLNRNTRKDNKELRQWQGQQQLRRERLQVEKSQQERNEEKKDDWDGDQMSMTQKLNSIRDYLQGTGEAQKLGSGNGGNGSRSYQNSNVVQQAPTVQIKKCKANKQYPTNHLQHKIPLQHNSATSNQSTQKKHPNLNNNPTTPPQDLTTSPTLKQHLPLNQKRSYKPSNIKTSYESQHQTQLVDSMIRAETQKYNQMMELIEKCGRGQNSGDGRVLVQLLGRLQQYKLQLQQRGMNDTNGNQTHTSKINTSQPPSNHQPPNNYYIPHSKPLMTTPPQSNPNQALQQSSSLLAFQSKDIYRSFQDYDFNTSQNHPNNDKTTQNKNNSQQQQQHQKQQLQLDSGASQFKGRRYYQKEQSSEQYQQMLKRYSRFISQKEQQLNTIIVQSKELTDSIRKNYHSYYYDQQHQPILYTSSSQSQQQQQQKELSSQQQKEMGYKQQQPPKQPQPLSPQSSSSSIQSSPSNPSLSCYNLSPSPTPLNPIFNQHLSIIKLKRQQSIQNLKMLLQQKKLTLTCYNQKLAQLQTKFNQQVKRVQTKRDKYIKALRQVKKQAVHVQKLLIKGKQQLSNKSNNNGQKQQPSDINSIYSYSLRKSFSADNIVLNTILKQPYFNLKNITSNNIRQQSNDAQILQQKSSFPVKNQPQNKIAGKLRKDDQEQLEQQEESDVMNEADESQMLLDGIDHDHNQNNIEEGVSNNKEVRSSPLIPHQHTTTPSTHNDPFAAALPQPHQSPSPSNPHQPQILLKRQPNQRNQQLSPSQSSQYQDEDPIINTESVQQSQNSEQLSQDAIKLLKSQQSQQQQHSLQSQQQQSYHKTIQQSNSQTSIVQINTQPQHLASQCSQQLQQLLLAQIINQFLTQIYLNNTLLKLFRPFIQEIFEFTPITDTIILQFIRTQLPRHYPSEQTLLARSNQPLNPSSLQILKLVRDLSFQIPQYDLILPQQTFRLVRKSIQHAYTTKIQQKKHQPIIPNTTITNPSVIQRVHQRQSQKRLKIYKYLQYQRDMQILYMKCVFNCYNQFLIEEKSAKTLMNSRSTIGPGQLELSLKEFNVQCDRKDLQGFFTNALTRVELLLRGKCMLPVFKSHKDVEMFQRQMLNNIKIEIQQTEYKWVNYMDDVLEVWYQVVADITADILLQATLQLSIVRNRVGLVSKSSNTSHLLQ